MTNTSMIDAKARVVRLEPLSASAFAPFGFVIETGNKPIRVNGDTAFRHDVGHFPLSERPGTSLTVSVFECEQQQLPLPIWTLERHPCSAQTIAPMQTGGFVAVVCGSRPDGGPDFESLRAFQAGSSQGVNYRAGVWHHGIIALQERRIFFVQSWQDGTRKDCETVDLPPTVVTR